MSIFAKTTVLSLTFLTGAAFAAHAQSGNIAALPPGTAAAPTAATAPIGSATVYPGPKAGGGWYNNSEKQAQGVAPSAKYVGPSPGGGWYSSTETQTQAVTPSDKYPGTRPH